MNRYEACGRNRLFVVISGVLALAAAGPGFADEAAAGMDASVNTLDAVQVTADYGYQPVDVKQGAPTIVDSVTYDDIEAPTGDNSIASMLVQVPGVSFEGDGDEPRYITIRGISADLNVTTLDGLALATLGENGSGSRRVNLQLVPSDIAERVDVFKAFTAEQDSAAIGGAVDIVSRSAFATPGPYFMIDGYGIYSSFEGPAGENSGGATKSHWGKGLKTAFADRFGADGQFGVVFTARYQDRVRNSSKIWSDARTYFNEAGQTIAGPDPALGWDGTNSLTKLAWGDYSNVITNKGASLKLEWRPREDIDTFAMGYLYNRRESSTMNSTNLLGDARDFPQRDRDTGTVAVDYIQSVVRYNQWDRTASGLIGGLDWRLDEVSGLSLRAGYTRESYQDTQPYLQTRTTPDGQYFSYRMSELPELTGYTGDLFSNRYVLRSAEMTYTRAKQNVLDLRADYAYNAGPGAMGFGFKTGLRWSRMRMGKDVDSERRVTGSDATGYMYDPGYSHHGSNGLVVPWPDYDYFYGRVYPGLAIDAAATRQHSTISDYAYEEEIANAYLSLHYATEATHYILGLRYDDVGFDGRTPLTLDGTLTDQVVHPHGGDESWLPSFNVVHDFNRDWKLRASASRTIGRPTPGHLAQAESRTCGDETTGCSITRGNPELKPRRADNYDLALERYFGGSALIALTAFRKDIADDIFTLTTDVERDGVVDRVRQPMNAETSTIQGLELALVNRAFAFHPNLGASFNLSRLDGGMNYVTDSGARGIDRMLYQPDWMANLTVSYRIPAIDGTVRLSVNHQDDYLTSIGSRPWDDKYVNEMTTMDLSFWHKVGDRWTFKYEIDNLLDAHPEWYHARDIGGTISQRDEYGQGVYFHAIYSLD
ncbi:TonB-dependent receptor [Vulcaniibacterium tengchongense]|uniref:TonB-dependent receptor n=1 Tax=Vulcaniibacterium tengchongense TaxID=1273429 RepID=A0A3N4VDY5_9GAMM|nr:TonB-dependent receptor [Vulcaniibacterium tengchongense]